MPEHDVVKSGIRHGCLLAQNLRTRIGKQVCCTKCGRYGVLNAKVFKRKTPGKAKAYLYVRHWIPGERKILWHYYGKMEEDVLG
jgi:hypothetical protein